QYCNTLANSDRRVILGELVTLHQIDASQEFVCRIDSCKVFTWQVQEIRQPSSGCQEDRIETFFSHQLIDGLRFADHTVCDEFDTYVFELANLTREDGSGQPELRYAIRENATKLVK